MIYFTADTHFDHANIVTYSKRPFKDVDHMNEALIQNWNEVVYHNDTVYHLGDFTLGGIDNFNRTINRLEGDIKIIPGGHDYRWLKDFKQDKFSGVEVLPPLVSIELDEIMNGEFKQVLVMCHYSMQVWDRSHYGSWHLFGHSHGNLKGIGMSFDCGVDANNFYPVSLGRVQQEMLLLKPVVDYRRG